MYASSVIGGLWLTIQNGNSAAYFVGLAAGVVGMAKMIT
jgi:hypothetical protein